MYDRPGKITYVPQGPGAPVQHNAPVKVGALRGFAIKQKATKWSDGFSAGGPATTIGATEPFAVKAKGVGLAPLVSGATRFAGCWINPDNTLALDGGVANSVKLGLIVELPGDRGCPAGFMRVDLDLRDSF
jgi:hypothetical protein